jgi:hypothetical protein
MNQAVMHRISLRDKDENQSLMHDICPLNINAIEMKYMYLNI